MEALEKEIIPFLPLARALLERLHRARQMPVHAGIDSSLIAAGAIRSLPAAEPGGLAWSDWDAAAGACDRLMAAALGDGPAPALARPGPHPWPAKRARPDEPSAACDRRRCPEPWDPITTWLDGVHAQASAIDPAAVEILLLSLCDRGSREIADATGVGLRLVERILADWRAERECRAGG